MKNTFSDAVYGIGVGASIVNTTAFVGAIIRAFVMDDYSLLGDLALVGGTGIAAIASYKTMSFGLKAGQYKVSPVAYFFSAFSTIAILIGAGFKYSPNIHELLLTL